MSRRCCVWSRPRSGPEDFSLEQRRGGQVELLIVFHFPRFYDLSFSSTNDNFSFFLFSLPSLTLVYRSRKRKLENTMPCGIQSSRQYCRGFPDNGYVSRYQDLNSTRVQMIRGTLKIAWKREVSNSRAKHMQIHSSIPRQ